MNAVSLTGITRRYVTDAGTVLANDRVNLDIAEGELHALVGENGAGKSTLVQVLCGLVAPEAGGVSVRGRELRPGRPQDALDAGVGLVAQHFSLIPRMTVWENVHLGCEPRRGPFIDRRRARQETRDLARELGVDVDPDSTVEHLPVAVRQSIEIMKALHRRARVLVLDEPTSSLSPPDAARLFERLERIRANGTAVLLVTHRIDEVLHHADRATVLRDGRRVAHFTRAEFTRDALVSAIVGPDPGHPVDSPTTPVTVAPTSPVLLQARNLTVTDRDRRLLDGVSFSLRSAKLLGIAGVAGNGQAELVAALMGTRPATGEIFLDGAPLHGRSVGERRRAGLSWIPEDRHGDAVILPLSLADNLVLGEHRRFSRHGILDRRALLREARARAARFDVRAVSLDVSAGSLSGGNQQKAVPARELGRDPRVAIAFNPTHGLDVAGQDFVHASLDALRSTGRAVILVSGDIEELLALCDRILVLHRGRIVGEQSHPAYDRSVLGTWMTGGR